MIFREIAVRFAAACHLRFGTAAAPPRHARITVAWRRDAASGRLYLVWKKVSDPQDWQAS